MQKNCTIRQKKSIDFEPFDWLLSTWTRWNVCVWHLEMVRVNRKLNSQVNKTCKAALLIPRRTFRLQRRIRNDTNGIFFGAILGQFCLCACQSESILANEYILLFSLHLHRSVWVVFFSLPNFCFHLKSSSFKCLLNHLSWMDTMKNLWQNFKAIMTTNRGTWMFKGSFEHIWNDSQIIRLKIEIRDEQEQIKKTRREQKTERIKRERKQVGFELKGKKCVALLKITVFYEVVSFVRHLTVFGMSTTFIVFDHMLCVCVCVLRC